MLQWSYDATSMEVARLPVHLLTRLDYSLRRVEKPVLLPGDAEPPGGPPPERYQGRSCPLEPKRR